MAPFKFGKKLSKDKLKQEHVSPAQNTSPSQPSKFSPSPQAQPHGLVQSQPPSQPQSQPPSQIQSGPPVARIPQPALTRVFPTPTPAQQRNVSSASALQQHEYTPWNRIKLTNSPFPRYRHVSSSYVSDQNQVYVIGGLHDQSVYGDTWIITSHDNGTKFSSRTVEISDSTPPPRVGHASTLCGNAFVIFGGDTHKVNSEGLMDDDVYLFNINSYKWTIPKPVGPRPLGRYGHKISVIATSPMKTKLYIFGGQFDDTYFNDLAVFDLSSFRRLDSHWQFIKPQSFSPPPLTNHTMISYDHKLWVFGGDTPQGLVNDVFVFDPQINDWYKANTSGEKPPPLQEHAAVLYGDLLCIVGGKDEQDVYSNSVYFLNLRSLKWFKFPYFKSGIPQGRSGHSLTLLPNNKLLIMGGDKFDFARIGEDDLHTSEADMGCGTILYTLDLSRLRELCPGIMDSPLANTSQRNTSTPTSSPRQMNKSFPPTQNILTPYGDKYQTPQAEQGAFTPIENPQTPRNGENITPNGDQNTPIEPLATSVEAKKPKSPIPQIATSSLPPANMPPRVVSLSSNNDSDATPPRFNDSQISEGSAEEYGIATIGSSPSKHEVIKRSMEHDDRTLEQLPEISTPTASEEHDYSSVPFSQSESNAKKIAYQSHEQLGSSSDTSKEELKSVIEGLRQELQELKLDAERRAQTASQRIKEVVMENSKLQSEDSDTRLLKLQTNFDVAKADKMAHQEHATQLENILSQRFLDVEKLNEIIKDQSKRLGELEDEETFKEKYNDLMTKYDALLEENDSLKLEKKQEKRELHNSIRDYSSKLEELLSIWKEKGFSDLTGESGEQRQQVIAGFSNRIDVLLKERTELSSSKQKLSDDYTDLQAKCRSLESELSTIEQNYKDSLNSVNNASRALTLSQDELNRLKQENKRLNDELEEMKYKSGNRADTSLTSNDDSLANTSAVTVDSSSDMRDAPYKFKIKDLKAELFIIKQERDSLKDDVMELKKKLLNLENDDD